MKKYFSLGLVVVSLLACSKIPISGRKQVNLLPESQMIGMSVTAYGDFLTQNPAVPLSDPDAAMVARVGDKIAKRVEEYLADNKQSKRVEGFEWEFKLVEQDIVNAWCMPGGKVVFYRGILPVTKNEAGLAVVMGHEIAHAIARHGNERMSQGVILQAGGATLSVLMSEKPQAAQDLFLQSYGVASGLGVLSYSRKHESEADRMGLVFMAMAGYDPHEAVDFWTRMSEAGGAKPPEILSTHPSDERRISDIEEFMGEAMFYYNAYKDQN